MAVARLAGVRDLILGAIAALAGSDRSRLREASLAGVAADAGDSLVFASALVTDGETVRAGRRGVAAAVPATVAGLWLAWRLRPGTSSDPS